MDDISLRDIYTKFAPALIIPSFFAQKLQNSIQICILEFDIITSEV